MSNLNLLKQLIYQVVNAGSVASEKIDNMASEHKCQKAQLIALASAELARKQFNHNEPVTIENCEVAGAIITLIQEIELSDERAKNLIQLDNKNIYIGKQNTIAYGLSIAAAIVARVNLVNIMQQPNSQVSTCE